MLMYSLLCYDMQSTLGHLLPDPKHTSTRKVMLKKIPIMKSTTLNIAQQNKKSTCLFSFA